jgi:uncharacterized membrane protein YbhN (UPF0104 family)
LSLIPVPGGIGAAEATLSAGLIAVGVDESTAFAIAVTQRLSTFYLPPIWGYFSLRWLITRATSRLPVAPASNLRRRGFGSCCPASRG